MKQIINRVLYDTDKAEKVAEYWNGCSQSDFNYLFEELYVTKNGRYFIAGVGGASSKYSETVPSGGWTGGSRIKPISNEEVIEWLEDAGEYSKLEELFPDEIVEA
jgi:hypothetical protein